MRMLNPIKYILFLIIFANLICCAGVDKTAPKYIPLDASNNVDKQLKRLPSLDVNVRLDAIIVLGTMGEKAKNAAPDLIKLLKDKTQVDNPSVNINRNIFSIKGASVWALGQTKDKRAANPLLFIFKEEKYNRLNTLILEALGKIGDKSAVEPMITLIALKSLHSSDAAAALGKMKEKRAIKPLINMLKSKNPAERDAAEKALIEITGHKPLEEESCIPFLKNSRHSVWQNWWRESRREDKNAR